MTDEQLKFESEFANTEVDTSGLWRRIAPPTGSTHSQLQTSSSAIEPSLSDSKSFEVFHDSWAHHSRNTSHRGNTSRGGNVSRGGNISRGGNTSRGGNVSYKGNVSHGGSNISGIQSKKNGPLLASGAAISKPILGERR